MVKDKKKIIVSVSFTLFVIGLITILFIFSIVKTNNQDSNILILLPISLIISSYGILFFLYLKLWKEIIGSQTNISVIHTQLDKKIIEKSHSLETSNDKYEKKIKDLSILTHVLCHDLKNPIGSSLAYISLFKIKPEKQMEYLEIIKSNLENSIKTMDLVKTLIAFEEGKINNLDLKSTNMSKAIKQSYSALKEQFNKKKVKLNIDCLDELRALVEEDSFINSVLNNLLSNALKFSNKNSIINISVEKKEPHILVTLTDQGIGIPSDLINNIYDPSVTTSRVGTDGEKGTGFGLPIVKNFIKSYGGQIEVDSKDICKTPTDHGTTFRITLKMG